MRQVPSPTIEVEDPQQLCLPKMETMCLDPFRLGEEIRSLVPPVHQQQCSWMGLSPSQLERSHPCRSKTAAGIKEGLLPFPTPQVGLPCTTLPMSRMSLKEATLLQYGNHHLPALTETLEAE